ncbi:MAG: DUF3372 domain-containing protein [Gammaproteobacteria bacterium]|nr:DUF3372 domain-containing protein [Gammaproteobacteria bacterium]
MQDNFYHIGLPPAEKDQVNWPLIRNIIQKNQGKDQVGSKEIKFSYGIFKEFLAIRAGMPHFRLSTSDQILEKVQFHNTGEKQQKGLIVMSITGENENVLVIFNFSNKSQFFSFKNSNNYHLHPVQITGIDKVVKQSFASSHGFTVPGLTTAVFVTD